MLFAKNEIGEIVTVRNKFDYKLWLNQKFYCPDCQEQLILKIGEKKKPHFSHKRKMACDSYSKGETEQHLIGKEKIYSLFLNKNYEIALEKYFFEISQRADLYIKTDKKKYVIEFQCSIVSPTLVGKRTEGYKNIQLHCLWVLSYELLKEKQTFVYVISDFLLFFASFTYSFFPSILFFDTTTNKFKRVYIISSLTSTNILGYVHSSPSLSSVSKTSYHSKFIFHWYNKNVQSRMWMHRKLSKWKRVRLTAYQKNIPLSLYPIEIFLPVPASVIFQTPLDIWQFHLYIDLIHTLKLGEDIHFGEIHFYVQNNPHVFRVRKFLHAIPSETDVVFTYFDQLVYLGYLEKRKESYRLVNLFVIPSSVESGASQCAELSKRIIEYNINKSNEI